MRKRFQARLPLVTDSLVLSLIAAVIVIALSSLTSVFTAQTSFPDPLPSWNQGTVKTAIIEFVSRTTAAGSPDYIPPTERIATFDNDGTLWPEQPLIQGMFVLERLKAMGKSDPSLRQKQPFQAALEGDLAYIKQAGEEAIMQLVAAVHANQTQEQFEAEARVFFAKSSHPTFKVPYTQLAYQPMVELLAYLRKNGFQTWICSGGGIDFLRVISEPMYGIPPQQVIGSSLKKEFLEKDGKSVLWREAELASFNDKGVKPLNIDLHIGKRPVFAAGNVRSGGDIAMLTYSQGQVPLSLQLLLNHDDAEREFAYSEPDDASLTAAQEKGWQVVSLKKDWQRVFAFQSRS
jgi:hypothetical protein